MDSIMKDLIHKDVEQSRQERREAEAKKKLQDEFKNFDFTKLPKMKNSDLAAWQAKYSMDSPQYLIALQEWNRRALAEQIKSTRWAAVIGLIATLAGVIIGAILAVVIPRLLSP